MFTIFTEDNVLVKRVKVEANIILASIYSDTQEHLQQYNKFVSLIKYAANIEYNYSDHRKLADRFSTLIDLILGKPLSPLTFEDNEFYVDDIDNGEGKTVLFNKRYEYIRKDVNIDNSDIFTIMNFNAYSLVVKKFYSNKGQSQINIPLSSKMDLPLTSGTSNQSIL